MWSPRPARRWRNNWRNKQITQLVAVGNDWVIYGLEKGQKGVVIPSGERVLTHLRFVSISAGWHEHHNHFCGIVKGQKGAMCWRGTTKREIETSKHIKHKDLEFVSISSGPEHSCGVVKADGSVKCWGKFAGVTHLRSANNYGQSMDAGA